MGMDIPHLVASGMGGIRTAGDLVARMMYTKNMKCHECVLRDGEKIAPRIQREIATLEADAKRSVEQQKAGK